MSEISGFLEDETNFTVTEVSKLFDEVPVSLDEFLYSHDFLGFPSVPGLSKAQYELVQMGERIYFPETFKLLADEVGGYWKEVENLRTTNTLVACWGKGGGKDAVIRLVVLRVVYLAMCLKSPQEYFGMPESASIHVMNCAGSADQARTAFFEPMTRDVRKGWFAGKSTVRKSSISFDEKNIEMISGHSSVETAEGKSLIAAVVDEVDAFKSRSELTGLGKRSREASTTSEAIIDMMRSSAMSRFPQTYKLLLISFPRYKGSKIFQLVDEAKKDNELYGEDSKMYVSGPLATWEANPTKKKEDFYSEYRRDPMEAAARYECKPVSSSNPYFRDPAIFENSVDVFKDDPAIKVTYELKIVTDENTGHESEQWEPVYTFADWFKPVPGARYAMHGDLAIKGDRAGVAMSHVVDWIEKDVVQLMDDGSFETTTENLPIIRNDFTIAFEADIGSKPAREIKVRWARELAFELIKRGFLITRYTFDQFQSSDSMQILDSAGIHTERVSTDINNNVWRSLKDVASDGRLRMEKNDFLIEELSSMVDLGRKVDHLPGRSKDLADAFACSIVGAIKEGGSEDEAYEEVQYGDSIFNYEAPGGILAENMPLGVSLGGTLPIGMNLEAPFGG